MITNGYYPTVIPLDFVIVGKDWWLERTQYDGSEWFEFKTKPEKPKDKNVSLSPLQFSHYFKLLIQG